MPGCKFKYEVLGSRLCGESSMFHAIVVTANVDRVM
jgi:hypothetical protein